MNDGSSSDRIAPVPNNLPARHRDVLGRDREIAALDEALRRDRRVTLLPATPLRHGGIGASAIALAYARRALLSRAYPAGVFWLHAAGKPAEALARLAHDLRVLGSDRVREQLDEEPLDAPTDDVARAVRLALQAPREPSLVILDDADAEGWADRLPLGEVRVIMTTGEERFAFRRRVAIAPLPGPVAADQAREIGARPRDAADRLALESLSAKELGGIPLAVELAALYVIHAGRSWSAYATRLRTQTRLMTAEGADHGGYAPSVVAAIDVAIERNVLGSPARRLLDGAAIFVPHAVPIAWALAAADLDPSTADAALAPLAEAGLVTADPVAETISLHRFVHQRARDLAPAEFWSRASRRAAAAVAVWMTEGSGPSHLGAIDARRPHIDEALLAAERAGADLAWVIITDRLGMYLERRSRFDEARAFLESAVQKAEQLDPPDPGQLRVCLSNLAAILVEMGHAKEARPLLERALAIDDEPTEEVPSSVRLSKLSRVLSEVGHADAARPLLERALATAPEDEAPPPPSSPGLPQTARVLNELRAAGEEDGLLERALHPRAGGAPDVTTIFSTISQGSASPASNEGAPSASELTSLGLMLYALGQPGDAKPLLERALASDMAVHGPDHPEVAGDLMNLAAVLGSLGDRARSRACLERAKAIVESTLPEDDPLRRGIELRLSRV